MIGAIATLVSGLLPSIINGLEGIFAKPKSGVEKMDAALQMVKAVTDKLVATGVVTKQPTDAPLTDDALRGMIEGKLAEMKASGALGADPNNAPLYILRGTVTPLGLK